VVVVALKVIVPVRQLVVHGSFSQNIWVSRVAEKISSETALLLVIDLEQPFVSSGVISGS
jgi:hypothetical protein